MDNHWISDETKLQNFVNASDIHVPDTRLKEEIHMRKMELKHMAQYRMMCGEADLFTIQQEMNEQIKKIPDEIYREIKTELVLDQVIKENHITPDQDELKTEAERIARHKNISPSMMDKFFGKDYSLLIRDLQVKKAINLICGRS